MTKIEPTQDREAIAQCAARWIARRDAGLQPHEQAELDVWLEADPQHGEALRHYASTWSVLDRPRQLNASTAVTDALFARRKRRQQRWTRIAAVVGLLIFSGSFWHLRHSATTAPAGGREANAVVVSPEKRILPDGSIAELNAGTAISVDYSDAVRHVRLDRGEAHFQVMKNKQRPFVVEASGLVVRAVGTAFDVRVQTDDVHVLVTEGRVAVNTSSGSQPPTGANAEPDKDFAAMGSLGVVDAGCILSVHTALAGGEHVTPEIRSVSAHEMAERLMWRSPQLEFSDTPLAQAVELMNRSALALDGRPKLHLVVDQRSPALAATPVSAVFHADNTEAFVRMLEVSLGVTAERRGANEIILSKRR